MHHPPSLVVIEDPSNNDEPILLVEGIDTKRFRDAYTTTEVKNIVTRFTEALEEMQYKHRLLALYKQPTLWDFPVE